jgi:ABC-type polysaccharide/polyol phosphate export permease
VHERFETSCRRVALLALRWIKKVYFPRETLPIATVLFTFSQLLLALAIFRPALLVVSGLQIHWTAVLLIPLLVLHLLFTLGLAFVLATCTMFFRDVIHLTEVAVVLRICSCQKDFG